MILHSYLQRSDKALWIAVILGGLLVSGGCSSSSSDSSGDSAVGTTVSSESSLRDSWMYLVASDPSALAAIESDAAWDPWFAFFHNDLRRAEELFQRGCQSSASSLAERAAVGYLCIGLARTHIELATFYEDAAELDRVVQRQFALHRKSKSDQVLPSVHSDYFAGVTLLRSGEREEGQQLLLSYGKKSEADPLLAALAARMVSSDAEDTTGGLAARIWGDSKEEVPAGSLGELPSSPAVSNYVARLSFMEAVARGDVAKARSLLRPIRADQPDLAEELAGRGTEGAVKAVLKHHDPSFLTALSRYHALAAKAALGGASDLALLDAQAERLLGRSPTLPGSAPDVRTGLALVLFSSVPTPSDLLALERSYPTAVAVVPRLKSLEPSFGSAPSRNFADLDPFVAGSNKLTIRLGELISASGEGGAGMDTDMVLSERFRGQLLRERAAHYQASFDVRLDETIGADIATAGVAARSLLELALDKNPAPPNSTLRAARISLRNDPTLLMALARAELDTRRPSEANDYVRPLTSVYPELVPLRDALTLLDTAWNPPRVGAVQK